MEEKKRLMDIIGNKIGGIKRNTKAIKLLSFLCPLIEICVLYLVIFKINNFIVQIVLTTITMLAMSILFDILVGSIFNSEMKNTKFYY